MTITLTPEIERILTARAERQGVTPERLALQKLGELSVDAPISEWLEHGAGEGIDAEADHPEPRTLQDLAAARRRFLASTGQVFVEDELPPVHLSEG